MLSISIILFWKIVDAIIGRIVNSKFKIPFLHKKLKKWHKKRKSLNKKLKKCKKKDKRNEKK